MLRLACAALAAAALASPVFAEEPGLCQRWSGPETVGAIDTAFLPEASGLAVSRAFPGRLYHHNDSGDGPFFYVTDMAGAGTQKVSIKGFTPVDVEDTAVGPCAGAASCLYLADIGDNFSMRRDLKIVILAEKPSFAAEETPLRIINIRFPDRAHDAESISVHPDGDLYLITKPIDYGERRAGPGRVFKLTAAQLADTTGAVQTLTETASIDLPYLLWDYRGVGQMATSMDIAPDGKRFLLLTYIVAVEVNFDLSQPMPPSRSWRPGIDYRVIETQLQYQQEAIAYTPDGGFLVDSESPRSAPPTSPLLKYRCEAR